MWTIRTFHLEIVSRLPTPYVHFTRTNLYESPVRRIWGKWSRIALKINELIPANNVYTV
jgi:hypothetical protein